MNSKHFKRKVRAFAAQHGYSYQAAMQHLGAMVERGEPLPETAPLEPSIETINAALLRTRPR